MKSKERKSRKDPLRETAASLYESLPLSLRRLLEMPVRNRISMAYAQSAGDTEAMTKQFLIKEIAVLLWGIVLVVVALAGMTLWKQTQRHDLVMKRNAYGQGGSETELVLENEKEEREYIYSLEEQEISDDEVEKLCEKMFQALPAAMAGEDQSLEKISLGLQFPDRLEGYPFELTYQPDDVGLVSFDGSLNTVVEKATKTGVTVKAEYRDYEKTEHLSCTLVPVKKEKADPFDTLITEMKGEEEQTRTQGEVVIPSEKNGIRIRTKDSDNSSVGILILLVCLIGYLLCKDYLDIRDKGRKNQRECRQDFSLIVHLLTLYMGAGMSLATAVNRMNEDYQRKKQKGESRYAFEKLSMMARELNMGVRQKQACENWGRQFGDASYQKLALVLTQVLSKGSAEGRNLMNRIEQEAYAKRLEEATRLGEEASTKLLFPMILLLVTVMLLVMFPAIASFQTL